MIARGEVGGLISYHTIALVNQVRDRNDDRRVYLYSVQSGFPERSI